MLSRAAQACLTSFWQKRCQHRIIRCSGPTPVWTTIFFKEILPAIKRMFSLVLPANAVVYYLPGTTGWGSTFGWHEHLAERYLVLIPTELWNPQMQTADARLRRAGELLLAFNITGQQQSGNRGGSCTNRFNPVWQPVSNQHTSRPARPVSVIPQWPQLSRPFLPPSFAMTWSF